MTTGIAKDMTETPNGEGLPDGGPKHVVAQNADEPQTVAHQAETAIEASVDGRTDDGYKSDSASAASTSLSLSMTMLLKTGGGIINSGKDSINCRTTNRNRPTKI